MKKQIVIVAAVAILFVAGYVTSGVVLVANDCQKPSGNTKGCYRPSNDIGSCESLGERLCNASDVTMAYMIYEIEKFPAGVVESGSGYTTEERVNCWRKNRCKWDAKGTKCVQTENWSFWFSEWKTVVDPNGVCPES